MKNTTILQNALQGKPLKDVFILDGHGHLDGWKPMSGYPFDRESLLAGMDRVGIDMLCINKWNCPDSHQANTDVADALKKYPQRFIGYAATQPCLGNKATREELRRCFDELGFTGIKIHNAYEMLPLRDLWGLPEFQKTMEVIWEFASERRCTVLCHWTVPVEVIQKYPDVNFILAHALSVRNYANVYGPYPNVYFDTAASTLLRGTVEYFIQKVGAERILYGSDMPIADPAYRLGQIIGTRVEESHLRKIMGVNMAKLLKIEIPAAYR